MGGEPAPLQGTVGFVFSIQSSLYGAITVAKISLFSTWIRSTVSFYSMLAKKSTRLDVKKLLKFGLIPISGS